MLASLKPRLQQHLYLGQNLNVTLSWNGAKFLYLKEERKVKRKGMGWGHIKSSNIKKASMKRKVVVIFVLMVDSTGSNGIYTSSGKTDLYARPKLVCVGPFGGVWGCVLFFS